jgi:hypothetical protein
LSQNGGASLHEMFEAISDLRQKEQAAKKRK